MSAEPAAESAGLNSRADDFDRLLSLADTLQDRIDDLASRLAVCRVLHAGLLLTLLVVITMFILVHRMPEPAEQVGLVLVAGCYLLTAKFPGLYHKQGRREERALASIVTLLHEVESAVAEHQGWTALQRASVRIRLSRLEAVPIDDGSVL